MIRTVSTIHYLISLLNIEKIWFAFWLIIAGLINTFKNFHIQQLTVKYEPNIFIYLFIQWYLSLNNVSFWFKLIDASAVLE